MRVVARPDVLQALREHGDLFVWPRSYRCCGGRQSLLEASYTPPGRDFELVHLADGFRVHASSRLLEPDELHLELDRNGHIRAYWNNQAWIG